MGPRANSECEYRGVTLMVDVECVRLVVEFFFITHLALGLARSTGAFTWLYHRRTEATLFLPHTDRARSAVQRSVVSITGTYAYKLLFQPVLVVSWLLLLWPQNEISIFVFD